MSFEVREVTPESGNEYPTMIVEIRGDVDIKLFKALVNRAMNCWDRAPADLKTFADIVTEGRPMQKYSNLGSETK